MPACRLLLPALLLLLAAFSTHAQDPEQPAVAEPRELPAEDVAEFDARLAEIEAQKKIVARLSKQFKSSEGLIADIISARMDVAWTAMFDDTVSLARDVSARRDAGFEVDDIAADLATDLQVFPEQAAEAIERLRDDLVLPTGLGIAGFIIGFALQDTLSNFASGMLILIYRPFDVGDSGVLFVVRPWVKTEDYWPTYWDLLRTIKDQFDAEGIIIPYPQHDVHVVKS